MHSEFVSLKKVNDSTYHTPIINSSGKMGLGPKDVRPTRFELQQKWHLQSKSGHQWKNNSPVRV